MRSGTRRGVSKWSRRKDRYIGRLYSDIGKGPSDSGIFRSTGELREFAVEYMGLIGPYGNRGDRPKGWSHPSPWSGPNWTREGGRPLPSFSFSLPLLYSLSLTPTPTTWKGGGGILLPVGVGLLQGRHRGRPSRPPPLLYIRGQGAPHRHNN